MASYMDRAGDCSDEEDEDDTSLCDFLESEVLGDEEGGDVDATPDSDAHLVDLSREDATAVSQVLLLHLPLNRLCVETRVVTNLRLTFAVL